MAAAYRSNRVLTCYRIGDPEGAFPIFNTEGARLYPGRWNTRDSPVLYASEHYSTALLEKLVHLNGVLPPNQHYIRIRIPKGTSCENFEPARHRGWDDPSESFCKSFGEAWYVSRRSAVLTVPSIPAGRIDLNFLINLEHREARGITDDDPVPVSWDDRLFSGR
jgi:RES domain-containing protein